MRTLVVSDLHLGARLRHDVLALPEPRRRLLAALEGIDRLVLLGDVVELIEGRPERALTVAEPILRVIGERLGPEREVVVVPGNHDVSMVRPWIRAQDGAWHPGSGVPRDATPELARVTAALAPARVSVNYPGVWLSERVWATHGHYLDRHLLPESAFGITRGLLGRLPHDGAAPIDYELGPSLTRLEALLTQGLPRPLATLVEDLAELLRASTMPRIRRTLLSRRLAPVSAKLLGAQMRRASIPALARVVHRLGIDADHVVFGHVHRVGPLPEDEPLQWQGPGGRPRILNTGSWVYEPQLLHRVAPPHPYWPGGAVLLEPGATPRAISLLDDLDARDLH
jgi:UDP-2,3-diacylglucosamine pyrophosphatase LpxH